MKTLFALLFWGLAGSVTLLWMMKQVSCESISMCGGGVVVSSARRFSRKAIGYMLIGWGVSLTLLYKWLIHGVYEKWAWLYAQGTHLSNKIASLLGKGIVGKVRSYYPIMSRWQRLYFNTNIVLVSVGLGALTRLLYHAVSLHYLSLMVTESLRQGNYIRMESLIQEMSDHLALTIATGTALRFLSCAWVTFGLLIQWKSKNLPHRHRGPRKRKG